MSQEAFQQTKEAAPYRGTASSLFHYSLFTLHYSLEPNNLHLRVLLPVSFLFALAGFGMILEDNHLF